jgi:hypothetical protein
MSQVDEKRYVMGSEEEQVWLNFPPLWSEAKKRSRVFLWLSMVVSGGTASSLVAYIRSEGFSLINYVDVFVSTLVCFTVIFLIFKFYIEMSMYKLKIVFIKEKEFIIQRRTYFLKEVQRNNTIELNQIKSIDCRSNVTSSGPNCYISIVYGRDSHRIALPAQFDSYDTAKEITNILKTLSGKHT